MIESVQFRNFKALRNTSLQLGRFTLIVGPNGSGKSTALQALRAAVLPEKVTFKRIATAGVDLTDSTIVAVVLRWGQPYEGLTTETIWLRDAARFSIHPGVRKTGPSQQTVESILRAIRIYSFDAGAISEGAPPRPGIALDSNGGNLAVILDELHNRHSENFERLNDEMRRWLPEFDRILFDTTVKGQRTLSLRTREGHFQIPSTELSQGTLLALAILTLTYLPNPPSIVCLEEPDRGIHPRLLRDVRDAMYRLSYPENYGETREPVQVIATTHSPYLLDLYKDHPEEVVIANKVDQEVRFERLSDREDLDEILGDVQLGDAWYSGVLGGVPAHT